MRIICCSFCVLCMFAAFTYINLFSAPTEVGRRYLRRVSDMASKNILPQKIKAVLSTISSPAPAIATPLTIPKEFQKFTKMMDDGSIFVLTGDIADMWIRDSAAQVWPYRDTHPAMVTRVLQRQSMFILADPYANSYKDVFRAKVSAGEKRLGRGGWVATRNYEVDSGCYFLRLLHHMWKHHHVDVGPYRETASALLDTWTVEQHHEEKSPYRYPELARNGLGAKTAYTGMTWGAFRPSDDACKLSLIHISEPTRPY